MRTRVDLRFLVEAKEFSLRFTCDDCAHFDGERCAHGYPEGERRDRSVREGDEIAFCKEFEAS